MNWDEFERAYQDAVGKFAKLLELAGEIRELRTDPTTGGAHSSNSDGPLSGSVHYAGGLSRAVRSPRINLPERSTKMETPPEYQRLRDRILANNPPADLPECFGQLWEANVDDSPCRPCDYQEFCKFRMRETRLPEVIQQSKEALRQSGRTEALRIADLVPATGCHEDAVQALIDAEYEDGCPNTGEVQSEIARLQSLDELVVDGENADMEKGADKPARTPKPKASKKKARSKVTGRGVQKNPRGAESASRAADSARPPTLSVASVSELGESAIRAHRKELERHNLNHLPQGSTLTTEHKGRLYTATLGRDHWKIDGRIYPTLGKAAAELGGQKRYTKNGISRWMGSWDARRFWQLDRIPLVMAEQAIEIIARKRKDVEVNPKNGKKNWKGK